MLRLRQASTRGSIESGDQTLRTCIISIANYCIFLTFFFFFFFRTSRQSYTYLDRVQGTHFGKIRLRLQVANKS